MKNFLVKTLIFISLGIVVYLLSFVLMKHKLQETIADSELIVLGDSHTVSLSVSNTFNYSISGAPYILHYNFAKTFEDQFKDKKVIIAFGFHNISNYYQNRFNGTSVKKGWIPMVNDQLNAYSLIENSYDYDWISKNKISEIVSKKKLLNLYKKSLNEKRINTSSIGNDTILFNKTLKKHYSIDYKYSDILQTKYLMMLIDLLEKNNCTVFLINTTVTDYYYQNAPVNIKEYHTELLSKFGVKYYDLNKILSSKIDASCFRDADHLNTKGDKIIEEFIKREVVEK